LNAILLTLIKIYFMTETNPIELNSDGKQVIPSGIKTLTTLTFIGSGLSLVIVGLTPVLNKLFLGFMEKARTSGSELTAKQIEDMEKGQAVMELTSANMIPLMVIGFVSIALCVLGAVWMRKLKKDGFWIYVGGELLPVVGNFILLGTDQFTGVSSVVMAVAIPLVFIALYFRQMKYLVN
jgi:hypothetical protein